MTFDLPILPVDAISPVPIESFVKTDADAFDVYDGISTYFANNGRSLLSALLAQLNLSRRDTITILTTSDDVYVSSCVSLTCFNFASISRKIVDNTKVIIVIHEHGYGYPDMAGLRNLCDARGIALIEDCAHVMGLSYPDGKKIGTYGHHALFSLSKIFPIRCGGMLRSAVDISQPECDDNISKDYDRYYPYWQALNQARIDRHKIILDLKYDVIIPSDICVPWFTRLDLSKGNRMEGNIEFGATLRDDVQLVPTNPFVSEDIFRSIIDRKEGASQ